MIPVLTTEQMRFVDETSIGGNPTVGYSYMLKAGMGLFSLVKNMIADPRGGEIAIICGKGNNGGDGYVLGRLLIDAGYKVMCISLCEAEVLKGEARLAFNEYVNRKGNVLILSDVGDMVPLNHYRVVVDAIVGTGLKGNPHGLFAMAIEAINACTIPVISVDTPSGLNNDTGIPSTPCVKATVTISMGFPKPGLYFYPGRNFVGNLIVWDLGYPDEIVQQCGAQISVVEHEKLRSFLPPRHPDGSKFEHGLSLLVCGSKGLTGSATLASLAALRSGCGMAHLAAPESIIPILGTKLTETVLHSLQETTQGTPAYASIEILQELSSKMSAVCIGPGISHEEQTSKMVRDFVRNCKIPVVLDADGINAYKDCPDELLGHEGELILTPHRGEWSRVFGPLPEEPVQLCQILGKIAAEYNLTILLKGSPTLVATPLSNVYICPYGNSALATAGSGDVLSGIVVSLLAQGASVEHAAILGAYIQGEAGVRCAKKLSEYSVIASDLIDCIPHVIRHLLETGVVQEREEQRSAPEEGSWDNSTLQQFRPNLVN